MSGTNQYTNSLIRKAFAFILALVMMFYGVGCKNYFIITNMPKDNISEIEHHYDSKKPIVVHWYNSTFDLTDVTFDLTSLSGMLSLSEKTYDYKFLYSSLDKVYKSNEVYNINTIHVYLLYSNLKPEPGKVTIESKYISKIEIIEKDKAKTTRSHLLGWGSLAVLGAIIVAIAINPPVGNLSFPVFNF